MCITNEKGLKKKKQLNFKRNDEINKKYIVTLKYINTTQSVMCIKINKM